MDHDRRHAQLVRYLQQELAVSDAALAIALKHRELDTNSLPMVLWQYGLVSLEQLNQVFDWLKEQTHIAIHSTLSSKP